jgi:hypothetical protein
MRMCQVLLVLGVFAFCAGYYLDTMYYPQHGMLATALYVFQWLFITALIWACSLFCFVFFRFSNTLNNEFRLLKQVRVRVRCLHHVHDRCAMHMHPLRQRQW